MEIPLKAIRGQIGIIERAAREIARIQSTIPLPLECDLQSMIAGDTPLSEEAYVVAILQSAKISHEEGTLNVRLDLTKPHFKNSCLRSRGARKDLDLGALLDAVRYERKCDD